ncbi:MAG: RagB/SusD family nutrient uptake outer membrane protein [Chitinophagaceae bacterium]|nr:RagB/SusD family nutrient uptake outer membrane protein [Chitinophagaceae bacterium]
MKKIFFYCLSILVLIGCKDKFLDVKPSDSLVVPTTLKDFQAILDDEIYMTGYSGQGPFTALLFIGTDEFYLAPSTYNTFPIQYAKNAYVWENVNLYSGQTNVNDWAYPYATVYYANVVLDGLAKITETASNANDYNNIKGSALFYRANAFYQLAQAFAQPYNPASAQTDLGIPIRLTASVSEKNSRASVARTYDQIKGDLETALPLLPQKPLFNTRPSKAAVYALQARMNLGMENYTQALQAAQNCLAIQSNLLDFNTLTATASMPMPTPVQNSEIILSGWMQSQPLVQFVGTSTGIVDSTLYPLYSDGDLRKTVCFQSGSVSNTKLYKGYFTKSSVPFAGFATDEVYLVKAECLARQSDAPGAMDALNTLLKSRWKTGLFVPLTASSADNALVTVLTERRKELFNRGTRWTDLKRLNKDSRFAKTLYRNLNGKQYALAPGDPRYTWQIPDNVIGFNPGMPQNPR